MTYYKQRSMADTYFRYDELFQQVFTIEYFILKIHLNLTANLKAGAKVSALYIQIIVIIPALFAFVHHFYSCYVYTECF